jgi:hypothetical protein
LFGPLAHIDTSLSQKRDWKGKFNPPRFLRDKQATLPFSLKGRSDFLKTNRPEKNGEIFRIFSIE